MSSYSSGDSNNKNNDDKTTIICFYILYPITMIILILIRLFQNIELFIKFLIENFLSIVFLFTL